MQLFRASCATLEANVKEKNCHVFYLFTFLSFMYFIYTMHCFESRFHIHKMGHKNVIPISVHDSG